MNFLATRDTFAILKDVRVKSNVNPAFEGIIRLAGGEPLVEQQGGTDNLEFII